MSETITLKVPASLAAKWRALPEEERNEWGAALLAEGFEEWSKAPDADEELDSCGRTKAEQEADFAAIGRGFEASDRGDVISGEEFFARINSRLAK